jgi:hypothetical protein
MELLHHDRRVGSREGSRGGGKTVQRRTEDAGDGEAEIESASFPWSAARYQRSIDRSKEGTIRSP